MPIELHPNLSVGSYKLEYELGTLQVTEYVSGHHFCSAHKKKTRQIDPQLKNKILQQKLIVITVKYIPSNKNQNHPNHEGRNLKNKNIIFNLISFLLAGTPSLKAHLLLPQT